MNYEIIKSNSYTKLEKEYLSNRKTKRQFKKQWRYLHVIAKSHALSTEKLSDQTYDVIFDCYHNVVKDSPQLIELSTFGFYDYAGCEFLFTLHDDNVGEKQYEKTIDIVLNFFKDINIFDENENIQLIFCTDLDLD